MNRDNNTIDNDEVLFINNLTVVPTNYNK